MCLSFASPLKCVYTNRGASICVGNIATSEMHFKCLYTNSGASICAGNIVVNSAQKASVSHRRHR